jgi:hypothetical protein
MQQQFVLLIVAVSFLKAWLINLACISSAFFLLTDQTSIFAQQRFLALLP